jgi:two-component system LytT family response regulator
VSTLQVVIAEDEAPARHRLTTLLKEEQDTTVAATGTDGHSAVQAIRNGQPDLVFLDVQMPGLSGLEVVQEIGPEAMPATIFVTAYDEYAIDAFELAALDYLLKPFDDERFRKALKRARQHIQLREAGELEERLRTLLDAQDPSREARDAPPPAEKEEDYLERIAVETRRQVRVVPVERIDYIEADGPYVRLQAGEETHLVRERMKTLEERLDPRCFVRIHRSTIVHLDRVEALEPHGSSGSGYTARLRDGTHLRVSRSRRDVIEQKLGLVR